MTIYTCTCTIVCVLTDPALSQFCMSAERCGSERTVSICWRETVSPRGERWEEEGEEGKKGRSGKGKDME